MSAQARQWHRRAWHRALRVVAARCRAGARRPESDKLAQLRQSPLFAGLDRRDLEHVARRADLVDVEAGEILARAGQLPQEVLILTAGTARVALDRDVGHLSAGDVINARACLDNRPLVATVVAETSVSLWVIERHAFNYLVDHAPGAVVALLRARQQPGLERSVDLAVWLEANGQGWLNRRATLNPV